MRLLRRFAAHGLSPGGASRCAGRGSQVPGGALFGRMPAVEATCTVPTPVDVPARLSHAQKRELLAHAVAAVVTTALIAAPLVTPPAGSANVSSETVLPAHSYAGAVPAVAVEEVEALPVASPPPSPVRIRPRVRPEALVAANVAPQRGEGRKPLGRKLTGWLVGDGSIAIRPFPAVPEVRQ